MHAVCEHQSFSSVASLRASPDSRAASSSTCNAHVSIRRDPDTVGLVTRPRSELSHPQLDPLFLRSSIASVPAILSTLVQDQRKPSPAFVAIWHNPVSRNQTPVQVL